MMLLMCTVSEILIQFKVERKTGAFGLLPFIQSKPHFRKKAANHMCDKVGQVVKS